MKKILQPLVPRRREESSSGLLVPKHVPKPVSNASTLTARRPFRLWMTGSLAVVMAAMIPLRFASEDERSQAMRLLRHSRFDVSETLQRIELAALDRGFSVLAKVHGSAPVLVLASSIGGTLVVMDDADSRPAMPLGLMVSEAIDGGADVLVSAAHGAGPASDWSELPSAVVADLDALPGMVERALG